jgi:hypothetical protein
VDVTIPAQNIKQIAQHNNTDNHNHTAAAALATAAGRDAVPGAVVAPGAGAVVEAADRRRHRSHPTYEYVQLADLFRMANQEVNVYGVRFLFVFPSFDFLCTVS